MSAAKWLEDQLEQAERELLSWDDLKQSAMRAAADMVSGKRGTDAEANRHPVKGQEASSE